MPPAFFRILIILTNSGSFSLLSSLPRIMQVIGLMSVALLRRFTLAMMV